MRVQDIMSGNLYTFDYEMSDVDVIQNIILRIELAFQTKFHIGYDYFGIDTTDIDGNYAVTTSKLDDLGERAFE